MPPNIALDQAKDFGLTTVEYEIIDVSSAEEYMNQVNSLNK